MAYFYHEELARSQAAWEKIKQSTVTVCGAGALGANILESLARTGFANLRVIDRDRVEERNLSTQPYFRTDIGAQKGKILANSLYRAVGVKVEVIAQELTEVNADKLLSGIVLDCFDNSQARSAVTASCARQNLVCLHIGLANGYAEFIWNEVYRVPSNAQDDICDYPLARNLVLMATAIAAETLIKFIVSGAKENLSLTFDDLQVGKLAL